MDSVRLPAAVLAAGKWVPRTCVRHGQPAVGDGQVDLQSRPKLDTRRSRAFVFDVAIRTYDHLNAIVPVQVRGWPFCPECIERRRRTIRLGQALFFGGVLIMAAGIAVGFLRNEPQPLLMVPILAGFGAAIASGFVFSQSGWSRIAKATVSDDGESVSFSGAHPNFVAEARAVQER